MVTRFMSDKIWLAVSSKGLLGRKGVVCTGLLEILEIGNTGRLLAEKKEYQNGGREQ